MESVAVKFLVEEGYTVYCITSKFFFIYFIEIYAVPLYLNGVSELAMPAGRLIEKFSFTRCACPIAILLQKLASFAMEIYAGWWRLTLVTLFISVDIIFLRIL
jgi:hypothetical protein